MFDFEKGDWPDGMRVTYKMIRWGLLDCYYIYCRGKIHSKNCNNRGDWVDGELEIGYAYEQDEGAYRLPIENLMLEVVTLILLGGRGSTQTEKYHRNKITEILKENDLALMLRMLPDDERRSFEYDLKLLGIEQ